MEELLENYTDEEKSLTDTEKRLTILLKKVGYTLKVNSYNYWIDGICGQYVSSGISASVALYSALDNYILDGRHSFSE